MSSKKVEATIILECCIIRLLNYISCSILLNLNFNYKAIYYNRKVDLGIWESLGFSHNDDDQVSIQPQCDFI